MGDCVTGKGGRWNTGAIVSVILDVDNKEAYIQNEAGGISAETAILFGLNEGATVDDVLKKIPSELEKIDKVGDIKTTVRTDLGDDWLLCNGVKVSREVYEKLGEVIPINLLDKWDGQTSVWSDATSTTSGYSTINCITYANGYWVVGGSYYHSSTYGQIAYTTDPTGEWTTYRFQNGNSGSAITCIAYANGYWVAGRRQTSTSSTTVKIDYATDLAGPWSSTNLWTSSSTTLPSRVNSIVYANGYWAAACGLYNKTSDIDYASVAYTTDPTGEWTINNVWSGGTGTALNCITYANGYWVVGGAYTGTSTDYARIAYTTDVTGTWTTKSLWTGTDSGNITPRVAINGVAYANGYWVVGGRAHDGTTYSGRVAYAANLTDTFVTQDIWASAANVIGVTQVNCVTYNDGFWLVGGSTDLDSTVYARFACTTDPTSEWHTMDLWSSANNATTIKSIVYTANYCVAGGSYYDGTYGCAQIGFADGNLIQLPTISTDGAYNYIKAKE